MEVQAKSITPQSMNNSDRLAQLKEILDRRIVILDGAFGTVIQAYKLSEADYRGKQFASHPADLRLNNDLLNITQPHIIEENHLQTILEIREVMGEMEAPLPSPEKYVDDSYFRKAMASLSGR